MGTVLSEKQETNSEEILDISSPQQIHALTGLGESRVWEKLSKKSQEFFIWRSQVVRMASLASNGNPHVISAITMHCPSDIDITMETVCTSCSSHYNTSAEIPVYYPCPTVKAATKYPTAATSSLLADQYGVTPLAR